MATPDKRGYTRIRATCVPAVLAHQRRKLMVVVDTTSSAVSRARQDPKQ